MLCTGKYVQIGKTHVNSNKQYKFKLKGGYEYK